MPNTLLKLWFWLGFYMKIVGDWNYTIFFVNLQVLIIRYSHEQSLIYLINCYESLSKSFPCGSAGKESACNVGDLGLIPGLARSPGKGKGYLLQYSGLENPKDCIVHGVTKSQTWLSNFHFHLWVFVQNNVIPPVLIFFFFFPKLVCRVFCGSISILRLCSSIL